MHDKLLLCKLYLIESLRTSRKYNLTLEEFVISLSKQNVKNLFLESRKTDAKLLQRLNMFEKIVNEYLETPLKYLSIGLEDIIPETKRGKIFKATLDTLDNENYRNIFVKVVTYLVLKAKSVCIKQYSSDPIKKNKCFINGLNTLVSHLKSEQSGCNQTKKPEKCIEKLGKKIEEIEEQIDGYKEQNKNLSIRVR